MCTIPIVCSKSMPSPGFSMSWKRFSARSRAALLRVSFSRSFLTFIVGTLLLQASLGPLADHDLTIRQIHPPTLGLGHGLCQEVLVRQVLVLRKGEHDLRSPSIRPVRRAIACHATSAS